MDTHAISGVCQTGEIIPVESSLGFGRKLQVPKPGRGSSGARRLAGIAGLLAIRLRYMFHEHMNTIRNTLMYRNYGPLSLVDVIDMSSVMPKTALSAALSDFIPRLGGAHVW
jgi:hypothetical protein